MSGAVAERLRYRSREQKVPSSMFPRLDTYLFNLLGLMLYAPPNKNIKKIKNTM